MTIERLSSTSVATPARSPSASKSAASDLPGPRLRALRSSLSEPNFVDRRDQEAPGRCAGPAPPPVLPPWVDEFRYVAGAATLQRAQRAGDRPNHADHGSDDGRPSRRTCGRFTEPGGRRAGRDIEPVELRPTHAHSRRQRRAIDALAHRPADDLVERSLQLVEREPERTHLVNRRQPGAQRRGGRQFRCCARARNGTSSVTASRRAVSRHRSAPTARDRRPVERAAAAPPQSTARQPAGDPERRDRASSPTCGTQAQRASSRGLRTRHPT